MADDLRLLLEGMGETADEVADFLRGQGCQGFQAITRACPVAVYLLRHFSPMSRVSVRHNKTFRWKRRGELGEEALNPPPVSEFICNFDAGAYPDLIRAYEA